MAITVDLTTLANYSSLPSGTYTIKAVAKGTGTYTSSNKSTGVSYTKAPSGYNLTISGGVEISTDTNSYFKINADTCSYTDYDGYVSYRDGSVVGQTSYTNVYKIALYNDHLQGSATYTLNGVDGFGSVVNITQDSTIVIYALQD